MGRKVVDGGKGKTGRVFYDGNELCITSWEIEVTVDEVDTTNSCSAGYGEVDYGTIRATGSVEAFWDISANPFDAPPDFDIGERVDLKLYVHATSGVGAEDGPFWQLNAGMKMFRMGVTSGQDVKYSFDFSSHGPITFPTGNVSSG